MRWGSSAVHASLDDWSFKGHSKREAVTSGASTGALSRSWLGKSPFKCLRTAARWLVRRGGHCHTGSHTSLWWERSELSKARTRPGKAQTQPYLQLPYT